MNQVYPPKWLTLALAAVHVVALGDMPYGYYQFLRLVVTGYAGYIAYIHFQAKPHGWGWTFAFMALLYNPVFVIGMERETHAIFNFLSAVLIIVEWRFARRPKAEEGDPALPTEASSGTSLSKPLVSNSVQDNHSKTIFRTHLVIGCIFSMLILGVLLALKLENDSLYTHSEAEEAAVIETLHPEAEASGTELTIGSTLEWNAEKYPTPHVWLAGNLTITIEPRFEDGFVKPIVTVRDDKGGVDIAEGQLVSPGYSHDLTVIRNGKSLSPSVVLQSFSGGAHCCNYVTVLGNSGGGLKAVALGEFDGDRVSKLDDIDGDGYVDIVERDNAFLYAFAAYAYSAAPPQIWNVINGRAVDVSTKPAFKKLFKADMEYDRKVCRTGEDAPSRNGSCPAYVASAARVGQLDQAWNEMLQSYVANDGWDLPTRCRITTSGECPSYAVITYSSYPDALLEFLKDRGYIAQNWQPRGWSPIPISPPENHELRNEISTIDNVPDPSSSPMD